MPAPFAPREGLKHDKGPSSDNLQCYLSAGYPSHFAVRCFECEDSFCRPFRRGYGCPDGRGRAAAGPPSIPPVPQEVAAGQAATAQRLAERPVAPPPAQQVPPGSASMDPGETRTMDAVLMDPGEEIELDARLDEDVWQRAVPATNFVQRDPNNGESATERTEVRIVYNRNTLYMGVTMFDSEPDRLTYNQLGRDNGLPADDKLRWTIDTFLDGRTGYGQPTAAHPGHQQKLCALAGRRDAARHPVAERGTVILDVEPDFRAVVDQTLIAAQALKGVTQRGARYHRVKMNVERPRLGMLRDVQSEILVAGHLHGVVNQPHYLAHGHGSLGVLEHRSINAHVDEHRRRIVTETGEAGDDRPNRTSRQMRSR